MLSLGRSAYALCCSALYWTFIAVVLLVETVWWTAFSAGVLDGLGLPRGGLIALAVVPLVVVFLRVEDYFLAPRRARHPRSERTLVHEDDFGRLWDTGRDARVLEVVNATPEKDGYSHHYYLRVPPSVRTAREAVAWTFGLDESEYAPVRES